jgi:hypothetical protein
VNDFAARSQPAERTLFIVLPSLGSDLMWSQSLEPIYGPITISTGRLVLRASNKSLGPARERLISTI